MGGNGGADLNVYRREGGWQRSLKTDIKVSFHSVWRGQRIRCKDFSERERKGRVMLGLSLQRWD